MYRGYAASTNDAESLKTTDTESTSFYDKHQESHVRYLSY